MVTANPLLKRMYDTNKVESSIDFLNDYLLAQVTPGIVRRILESEGPTGPYVITPSDSLNRLQDYNDNLGHSANTWRDILGPISPP